LFDIILINISDPYAAQENPPIESFIADLNSSNTLYEDSFVSFALRYKYNDNEHSAIGPYSEPAFLPGRYLYKASIGFNESMINTLSSLDIYDFIKPGISKDVKSIDIILKDHFSTNAYLVKSIGKNSEEWDFNNFEIISEIRGTTIPSLQLSRVYDAVPIKAKAQEFTASRLMYGNYTEGYNMLDDSMSDITFSCETNFENISTNLSDHVTASVNSGADNDLIARNIPFFNPEDTTNTKFIHNYYKSSQDTFFNEDGFPGYGEEDGNTLYCPKDIDQIHRFDEVPGTGPRYNSFLIPIFPANEHINGNTDTTLTMPTILDPTGQSYDVGATGNYQVYSTSHSDHYNSSDHDDYKSRDLPSQVRPLIYKAPVDGTYNIKASTEALVRYYYGTFQIPGMNAQQSYKKFYKRLPFRIEIHKVDINGVSQGIIDDSVDLIGSSDGLAVSQHNMQSQTNWYGSSFGEDTLQETRSGNIPINNGQTQPAPVTKEVELHREVSLTAGEYIAIFFSYQKSYDNNTNIGTTTVTYTSNSGNTYDIAVDDDSSSIRFLLDAYKTELEISAPQVISDIQVESPSKSVRSNRFYETGVVYSDAYGRDTTVMTSRSSRVEIPISYSDKKNALTCSIKSKAPYWATHYKYYVKESSNKYFNMVLDAAYSNDGTDALESNYYWLSFNSSDISKVNIDDNLILKKQHGNNNAANDKVYKVKVLDISEDQPSSISTDSTPQGKFFVKVKTSAIRNISSAADDAFAESLYDTDGSIHSDNGAIFEVEPKGTVRQGFYWETSKAYPITLNEVNAEDYIEVGDYVQMLYVYDSEADKFVITELVNSWNVNNTVRVTSLVGAKSFPNSTDFVNPDTTCNVNLNANITFLAPGQHAVFKFIKKDGSYVTAKAIEMFGSSLRLVPYTHPNGKINTKVINEVSLPWFNCYQWYNGVETDIVRDDFSGSTIYAYTPDTGKQSGFNASDYYPDYKQVTNKSGIIYSQIYNASSNIDASNQFILADKIVKKLNRSHGQINSLIARNNDVIALCEDKILKILSSGKDALFNADGNIQLTSSTNVLGQSIPFVGDFGCQHPESIALDEYRIYFVDKARGAVLRLSRDGMTEISSNGMDNWFDEQLERTKHIVGSFDDSKSEYNITLHEIISTRVSKNVYTLSFDESTNGWVSFKSFIKENGLSLNNKYYTFKRGRLYRHHSDDASRNNFYDIQYDSSVTTLINMQPSIVKSFSRVSYEGSQAEILKDLTDEKYTNIKSISGWSIDSIKTDQQEGEVDEFVEKEGKWFNNIKGK